MSSTWFSKYLLNNILKNSWICSVSVVCHSTSPFFLSVFCSPFKETILGNCIALERGNTHSPKGADPLPIPMNPRRAGGMGSAIQTSGPGMSVDGGPVAATGLDRPLPFVWSLLFLYCLFFSDVLGLCQFSKADIQGSCYFKMNTVNFCSNCHRLSLIITAWLRFQWWEIEKSVRLKRWD